MVVFIVPIQSYSDIITNSSSELFIASPKEEDKHLASFVADTLEKIFEEDKALVQKIYLENHKDWNKVFDIIDGLKLDSCSGTGGDCCVKIVGWDEVVHDIRKCDRNKFNKKGKFLWIWIDHNRHHSIKWIKENLNVFHKENC